MSDDLKVIVDIGSHTICAGLSSSERPTIRHRSLVSGGSQGTDVPIVSRGLIANKDAFEETMKSIYKSLEVDSSSTPTLLTSHPRLLQTNSDELISIMFETFSCPATYISLAPLLNLYAFGRTTGLSAVIGHDLVSWIPVFEGIAMPLEIGTAYLAGSTVNQRLFELLSKSHPFLSPTVHQEIIGKIKEDHCYIAENFEVEIQLQQVKEKTHRMPDGYTIRLQDERFRAPEVLFKPSLIGVDSMGIQGLIAESIQGCPIDTRRDLQSNICVSGGTSSLPGFKERLRAELRELDNGIFEKCKVTDSGLVPTEVVWTGGCILASLSTFDMLWISKEEYNESGPKVINKILL